MRRKWRHYAKSWGGIIFFLKSLKVFRLFSPEKNFRTRSRQKSVSVPLAANAAPQFFWCASLDFLAPKKIFGRGACVIDYPQVIVNFSPQNRLSFRLRLSSMTALSSASRFSCAGVVYHPPAPPYVAKSIQSPPKSTASIGIPCKMLFDDASLSLLQRYDYLKVIDYSSYSKKEHPTILFVEAKNSKVAKTFGQIGQDVLFELLAPVRNFENFRLR